MRGETKIKIVRKKKKKKSSNCVTVYLADTSSRSSHVGVVSKIMRQEIASPWLSGATVISPLRFLILPPEQKQQKIDVSMGT